MYSDTEERIRMLKDTAHNWSMVVEAALKKEHGKNLRAKHLTPKDRYRLLSLRTWMLKYKLSLEEILGVLVPIWSGYIKSRKVVSAESLGFMVSTLCGDKSQEILERHIKKTYPHDEHIATWRQEKQETFMRKRKILEFYQAGSLKTYVDQYHKDALEERAYVTKFITSRKRTRRRWLDSPWV